MTQLFTIEPLTANHNREAFDCGEASLNDFLKRFRVRTTKKA